MAERVGIDIFIDSRRATAGARQSTRALRSIESSAQSTERRLGGLNAAAAALGVTLGTVFSVQAIRSVLNIADRFNILDQRIRTATKSTGDYNEVSQELFRISQQNGVALEETVGLFQNLSRQSESLGATNDQILAVSSSLQQLGVIGGASTQALQFSLRQLSQAFAAGTFRAEEINSVIENTPEIAKRIEEGLGLIPGQLKNAVVDGRVLAQDVFETILAQAEGINAEFELLPPTLERAGAAFENAIGKALSNLDTELGFTVGIAESINNVSASIVTFSENAESVAELISNVENAFGSLAVVVTGRLVASLTASAAAFVTDTAQTIANQRAKAALAQTNAAAAVAKARESQATISASVASFRAIQAEIQAEIQLSTVRLQAQISSIGRLAQINKIAAARKEQAVVTQSLIRQEAQLAAASAQAARAQKGLANINRVTATSSVAAATGMRALGGAVAFLGGPVGILVAAVSAFVIFGKELESQEERTARLTQEVDGLTASYGLLTEAQLTENLNKLNIQIDVQKSKVDALEGSLNQARLTYGEFASGGGQILRARQDLDEAREALERLTIEASGTEEALKGAAEKAETLNGALSETEEKNPFKSITQSIQEQGFAIGKTREEILNYRVERQIANEVEKLGEKATAEQLQRLDQQARALLDAAAATNVLTAAETARQEAKKQAEKQAREEARALEQAGRVVESAERNTGRIQQEAFELQAIAELRENQYQQDLARQRGQFELEAQLQREFASLEIEAENLLFADAQARRQERFEQELAEIGANSALRIELENAQRAEREAAESIHQENLLDLERRRTAESDRLDRSLTDQRINNAQSAASSVLSILGNFGKKSFKLQKALAIGESIVNIAAGVAKALNNPYPANLGFAAQVAAEGAALIATIKSAKPESSGSASFSVGSGAGSSPSFQNSDIQLPENQLVQQPPIRLEFGDITTDELTDLGARALMERFVEVGGDTPGVEIVFNGVPA